MLATTAIGRRQVKLSELQRKDVLVLKGNKRVTIRSIDNVNGVLRIRYAMKGKVHTWTAVDMGQTITIEV